MKLLRILALMTLVASVDAMAAQIESPIMVSTATVDSESVETAVPDNLSDQDPVVFSNGKAIGTLSEITNVSSVLSRGGCHKCSPRQICCDDN